MVLPPSIAPAGAAGAQPIRLYSAAELDAECAKAFRWGEQRGARGVLEGELALRDAAIRACMHAEGYTWQERAALVEIGMLIGFPYEENDEQVLYRSQVAEAMHWGPPSAGSAAHLRRVTKVWGTWRRAGMLQMRIDREDCPRDASGKIISFKGTKVWVRFVKLPEPPAPVGRHEAEEGQLTVGDELPERPGPSILAVCPHCDKADKLSMAYCGRCRKHVWPVVPRRLRRAQATVQERAAERGIHMLSPSPDPSPLPAAPPTPMAAKGGMGGLRPPMAATPPERGEGSSGAGGDAFVPPASRADEGSGAATVLPDDPWQCRCGGREWEESSARPGLRCSKCGTPRRLPASASSDKGHARDKCPCGRCKLRRQMRQQTEGP